MKCSRGSTADFAFSHKTRSSVFTVHIWNWSGETLYD